MSSTPCLRWWAAWSPNEVVQQSASARRDLERKAPGEVGDLLGGCRWRDALPLLVYAPAVHQHILEGFLPLLVPGVVHRSRNAEWVGGGKAGQSQQGTGTGTRKVHLGPYQCGKAARTMSEGALVHDVCNKQANLIRRALQTYFCRARYSGVTPKLSGWFISSERSSCVMSSMMHSSIALSQLRAAK
jgi:hypothetical protein